MMAPAGGDLPAAMPSLYCVIAAEVATVLAVMRRNVRWSSVGVRYVTNAVNDDDESLDHPLISSLKSLRRRVFLSFRNVAELGPTEYLKPFLDVVKSDETGAPITGAALSSIHKLISLFALDSDSARAVIDAVATCRFEVTDSASEEAVLMRILQVLLQCIRGGAASEKMVGDRHVCAAVNACFRIVHQARSKSEILQRFSRHTMHELVLCVFSRLPAIDGGVRSVVVTQEIGSNQVCGELENGNTNEDATTSGAQKQVPEVEDSDGGAGNVEVPFGIPCMVEIFQFLCSLLNIAEHMGMSPRSNPIAFDEDVPLFALGLINSAMELGGPWISKHPHLLSVLQDELFHNLMEFGLSMSPLIMSMVFSIVLNLFHHLRTELKLQIEAFFSCVMLRLAESRYGAIYQQQEVALEALVDFCRQDSFVVEMYVNMDCDISSSNVFEDLINLLSKSAFPISSPLSSLQVLALEGLVAVVQAMADRLDCAPSVFYEPITDLHEYTPFWTDKCENCSDPDFWVKFVRQRKFIKRKLMIGADHFNRDPKKGLEFLQGIHLLPDKLDPKSVACFFRYTTGLDKNLLGDYLGNHDQFCIQVLYEFAQTFDFQDMNLDTALRLFLETFRLPGESQKIQRVLEAFSERYYEQSPQILANKDASLILSYSLILLNTDQHNVQVKKKMTEEDFIRNNRRINGGNDLPRNFLSELYYSICENEIKTIPDQGAGFLEMTYSRWTDLLRKSKRTSQYILCDSRPFLDQDMFAIMSGPTIAALSVVYDYAEHEEVLRTCIDGFMAVTKIAASHNVRDLLDDLLVLLCKFTTLSSSSSVEDHVIAFGDDMKATLATETVFKIANRYGDYIHNGWKIVVDCILTLHKLDLLPVCLTGDTVDETEPLSPSHAKPAANPNLPSRVPSMNHRKTSSGLMARFSLLLSLDAEEVRSQPTEEQLAIHQRTLETIQKCHIDSIFTESKFLQAASLVHLVRALIRAAGQPEKITGADDEDTAVFCLELLIAVTLNNRDRIKILWQDVYEHISSIVQSICMPCPLVEKAVFGLLRICQRLLPYKEDLADDLLRSLQLILKLDARVADAYCESITQEVTRLVKANASHIKSQMGWRTIASLISITARHPDAAEVGFEALVFIMSDGALLSPANFILCVEASRQFAESRVAPSERSIHSLSLMSESVSSLSRWSCEVKETHEEAEQILEGLREMWLRLVLAMKRACLDQREDVRNHALLSLQRCLVAVEGLCLASSSWIQAFDLVIFPCLDDLFDISQSRSHKDYRSMEESLLRAIKLTSKAFLQSIQEISSLSNFSMIWLGVLEHMEKYMKAKVRGRRSEKLQELIPELLKTTLLVMKATGILVQKKTPEGDSFWELTWLHVNNIDSSLQLEVFPIQEKKLNQVDSSTTLKPVTNISGPLTGVAG